MAAGPPTDRNAVEAMFPPAIRSFDRAVVSRLENGEQDNATVAKPAPSLQSRHCFGMIARSS